MKKKAHRKIKSSYKMILITILSVVFIASVYMLFRTFLLKEVKAVENVTYEYNIEKSIQYKVYLKENVLYDEEYLSEGMYYPMKLLDYMKIQYDIQYLGSEQSDINVEYQVFAKVNGYNMDGEVKTEYWTKEFPLTEIITGQMTSNSYNLSKSITLSMNKYSEFVDEVEKQTALILNNDITIHLVGSIKSNTSYGEVNEPIDLSLTSSLNNNLLNFSKSGLDHIQNSFKETEQKQLPVDKSKVTVFSLGICISLFLLVYVLFYTSKFDIHDILLDAVKRLKREYGSRMVELKTNVQRSYQNQFNVYSIKDLIKVSDELQKPIYFEKDDIHLVKDFKFHVQNGDDLYVFNVMESFDLLKVK